MASNKQGLLVVVWEWENKQRRWRPYPPEVTQQLERAHQKKLRSVFLGDSDPALINYCVNLSNMQQECKVTKEIVKVRRHFYPQSSPAGQGAVWQWAGDASGDWHVYDMCVQCVIEESWATGTQTLDLSESFPMCPYVINFCNLTQMNSRTQFTRGIRRIQQAAYPPGKPPATPQQPRQAPGPSMAGSSANVSHGNTGARPLAGAAAMPDRSRRRGSRSDDADVVMADTKPMKFLNKMFGRGNSGNSALNGASKGGCSELSNGRATGSAWSDGSCTSPPKPMPRTTISPITSNPPVPKPRTSIPHKPLQHHQHQHHQKAPQKPSHHQHHQHQHPAPVSTPNQHPGPAHQHPVPVHLSHPHHYQDEREERPALARNLRNEAGVGRFGSNHTLDSDCSSLLSGRRPSVDTISTYLSQDSYSVEVEDEPGPGARVNNHDENSLEREPLVENLIQVDGGEESMDDDVFGEDEEVCEVMRAASSMLLPSSPVQSHSQRHHQRLSYHRHFSSPQPSHPHAMMSPQQHCQFMPITSAKNGSDLGLQQNGVKRKRTGERATPGHPRMDDDDDSQDMAYYPSQTHRRQQKGHHGSRAPIAAEDRLLVQYTQAVDGPPDETCSICMWSLQEASGFSDDESAGTRGPGYLGGRRSGVVSLVLCDHLFHLACIREMAKSSVQFLECPNCKTLHGEKLGNQPDGHMGVNTVPRSLPGHPDCDTIQITYNIRNGIQGAEHPHPGRPYHAIGFPRIAYVPNNAKGKKVLNLLREAWKRRLVFTIGTSVTTGIQDAVTWNEIHHKTEWSNYNGHGYPDPGYLDNVLQELAAHGVAETTLV